MPVPSSLPRILKPATLRIALLAEISIQLGAVVWAALRLFATTNVSAFVITHPQAVIISGHEPGPGFGFFACAGPTASRTVTAATKANRGSHFS